MYRLRAMIIGLAFIAAAQAVSVPARLDALADRLARTAEQLAAESYSGFDQRDVGNQADVEALFFAQQFSAGSALFRRMVLDRRPSIELRGAISILRNQLSSAYRYSFGRRYWQEIDRNLEEISRELGTGRRDPDDVIGGPRVTGRMRWRGTVDHEVQIVVQGSNAAPRTIAGLPVNNAVFNFTSPLPQRRVTVEVKKMRGRGSVEVIQQPARDNDFTAVILVRDPKGGADDYEFEVIW